MVREDQREKIQEVLRLVAQRAPRDTPEWNRALRQVFLSMEDDRETLHGFLRLRLSPLALKATYPSLLKTLGKAVRVAMIRELHMYGQLVSVGGRSWSHPALWAWPPPCPSNSSARKSS